MAGPPGIGRGGRGRGRGRGSAQRPPRRGGRQPSIAAERVNQLRQGRGSLAVPVHGAINHQQMMEDEESIARILGRDSQSMIGQQLNTGVQRLSNQIANIQRARNNIRDMDVILNEIEQFQEDTDTMANNMANIEQMLTRAEIE